MNKTLADQAQRDAAIFEKERDVTVMAGAGTGKTELLSDRYIELIAPKNDKDPALDVKRIAAITFTRRAAGEIKNRIRSKLLNLKHEKLSDIRSKRVEDALRDLDTALMGTIHSFSDRLLSLRPIEAKISPVYHLIEDETALINETTNRLVEGAKSSTLKDQWSSVEYRPDEQALNITKDFFNDLRRTGTLIEDITRGFQTTPGIKSLIISCVNNRDKADLKYYRATQYDEKQCEVHLKQLYQDIKNALDAEDEGEPAYRALRERLPRIQKAIKAKNLGTRARYLQSVFNIPAFKKGVDFNNKNFGYQIRIGLTGDYNRTCTRYKELIMDPISEAIMAPLPQVYPVILAMYEDVKRRFEAIDQMDLLLKLRDVLGRTEVKTYYQSLFDHLFVDEFQDTDPIQAEIVLHLCEKPGSLTIIGDPKQSIYRFRRAEISEFARVVHLLKKRGALESRLSVNFRSSAGLIRSFNQAFTHYLGPIEEGQSEFNAKSGEVHYSPLVPFHGGAKHPSVRFLQLDSEGESASTGARELDAKLMARYVANIVKGNSDIKAKPHEIAILTRAMTHVGLIVKELKGLGIEVYVSGGTTYGESLVVRKFIYLLSLVSRDTAAGRALLFSPEVSSAGVKSIFNEKGSEVERWLYQLRKKRNLRAASLTALEVMEGQLFSQILGLGINSEDDLSNIYRFINLFDQQVQDSGLGFDEGVDWALQWLEDPPKMSSPLRSGENAVKILTIHQSKGLEFPVTILLDAYAGEGMFRTGALMTSVDGEQWFAKVGQFEAQYPTNGFQIKEREELQHKNEQKRLQYVACTRAEKYLIVPTALNTNERWHVYPRVWSQLKNEGSKDIHVYPVSRWNEEQDFLYPYEQLPEYVPLKVDKEIDQKWKLLDEEMAKLIESSTQNKWLITSPTSLKSDHQHIEFEIIKNDEVIALQSGGAELGNQIHEVLYHHFTQGMDLSLALANFAGNKEQVNSHVQNALKALSQIKEAGGTRMGEVPFTLYEKEAGRLINGIIDLILEQDGVYHIIDFKSDGKLTPELIEQYSSQLAWYKKAVLQANPKAQVKLSLLGTAAGELVEILDKE
ncbi:MAG: hypothetical protein CME62_05945 [Halobacteriovoraceae bacterium]|nr:hypothetical protein [Halobacteriovoraceae bacterium]|tara:strand:- start:2591 stop:5821 length:3231 start_codon:yes stop_codon:yes gene_type:complete